MTTTSIIAANLAGVRQRIAAAAERAGRDPNAVTLVAVTKYAALDAIQQLIAAGCHDLGESRPQQLWQRSSELTNFRLRWHLIGHLQRNKIHRTLPSTFLIHSADSLRLIEACGREAVACGLVARLLLEVNVSGDQAKHGFQPAELSKAVRQALETPGVEVRGLMAMAGLDSGADQTRREFQQLRQLRDDLRAAHPTASLDELSMGMSADFEIAVEEGATMVRVGSALFEGVES